MYECIYLILNVRFYVMICFDFMAFEDKIAYDPFNGKRTLSLLVVHCYSDHKKSTELSALQQKTNLF